jgi:hypothetical protein
MGPLRETMEMMIKKVKFSKMKKKQKNRTQKEAVKKKG